MRYITFFTLLFFFILFSTTSSQIIPDFQVNDDQGDEGQNHPSISTDGSGNFVIEWADARNGNPDNPDIYAQRYSSEGIALGSNFKVNDDPGSEYQRSPSISTDGSGNFIITWCNVRNGDQDDPDIYAQRFSSDGTTLGYNFIVTNTADSAQLCPDVKLGNNRIYTTWTDNRAASNHFDIWVNVLGWDNPVGIIDKVLSQVPLDFILHQNYPNPLTRAQLSNSACPNRNM